MTQTHLCEQNYQMLQKEISRKDVWICFNKCSRQYKNCSSHKVKQGLERSFTFFSYTLVSEGRNYVLQILFQANWWWSFDISLTTVKNLLYLILTRDKQSLCVLHNSPFTQSLCSYLPQVDKTVAEWGAQTPPVLSSYSTFKIKSLPGAWWRDDSPLKDKAAQSRMLKHNVKEWALPTNQKSGSAEKVRNKDY